GDLDVARHCLGGSRGGEHSARREQEAEAEGCAADGGRFWHGSFHVLFLVRWLVGRSTNEENDEAEAKWCGRCDLIPVAPYSLSARWSRGAETPRKGGMLGQRVRSGQRPSGPCTPDQRPSGQCPSTSESTPTGPPIESLSRASNSASESSKSKTSMFSASR